MKTAKILRLQLLNGYMHAVTLDCKTPSEFDLEQLGSSVLNIVENQVCLTGESLLQVGDSVTDDFGGEPIIAETHGQTEAVEIKGKESDYRDAAQQKFTGEGEK